MGKKKNGNGYGKGTFIDTKLILSKAFRSLGKKGSSPTTSTDSVQIILMLLAKRQFSKVKGKKGIGLKWVRIDENRIELTYKELESYGISRPTITRAIDELLAKGFIKIAERGGAYEKHKTLYSLTDEWEHWKVGDPPVRIRDKDVKRGYQGKPAKPFQSNKPSSHKRVEEPFRENIYGISFGPPSDKRVEDVQSDNIIPFSEKQKQRASTLPTHTCANVTHPPKGTRASALPTPKKDTKRA